MAKSGAASDISSHSASAVLVRAVRRLAAQLILCLRGSLGLDELLQQCREVRLAAVQQEEHVRNAFGRRQRCGRTSDSGVDAGNGRRWTGGGDEAVGCLKCGQGHAIVQVGAHLFALHREGCRRIRRRGRRCECTAEWRR